MDQAGGGEGIRRGVAGDHEVDDEVLRQGELGASHRGRGGA